MGTNFESKAMLEDSIKVRIKEDSGLGVERSLCQIGALLCFLNFIKEFFPSIIILIYDFIVMSYDLYCYLFQMKLLYVHVFCI